MAKNKPITNHQPPITNHQSPTTKLSWLPKKTFELEFTIAWKKAKDAYDSTLKEAVKNITLKGFRKGKAPIKLAEQNLDKQKLYEQVIKKLLPETYDRTVKQHNLKPIISPKIEVVDLKEGKDWVFKATACEAPEVNLRDYEKIIKGELAKSKIWTPGSSQDAKAEKSEKQSSDDKLKTVTKSLLENIKIEISDLLIDDEVNRMLSRLLDQVNRLGMTIDQYLSSKTTTADQLRANYQQQAENTLSLEFIIQAVVKDKNIKVDDKEIDKMIEATPDEKIRKQLETPMKKAYIASILAKRKALDYLTNL